MKKLKKLSLKKVTLRDLDDKQMQGVDGGCCPTVAEPTCITCVSCETKCGQHTCVKC